MVLLLLPTTTNKLKMQWQGPFRIVRKVARHDYRLPVNGLLSLLEEYTDIPGKTDLIEYDIRLTTEDPVRSKPYPVPHARKDTIQQEVEMMLRMGVIEESTSPYASPVVLVGKKDGKNRLCVDYRQLTTVTIVDNEPIPNIEELMTEIGDAKFFTKVDLSKGYWQIPVAEKDREKTAFVTPRGAVPVPSTSIWDGQRSGSL